MKKYGDPLGLRGGQSYYQIETVDVIAILIAIFGIIGTLGMLHYFGWI